MKKLISIFLCISILCGCGGMTGLRRQSTQNLHKTINENNEIYWNNTEGHSNDVKMILQDENHSQIKIPVDYTVEVKNIDKIPTVPSLKNENITELQKTVGKCTNCTLNKEYLTIDLVYQKETGSTSDCIISIIFAPIGLLMTLADDYSLSDLGDAYKRNCAGKGTLQIPGTINISEPENILKLKEMGVIDYTFDVTPNQMEVSCDKKSCAVLDQNGNFVNKVIINKNITANENKIKRLATEEKLAEQKRKKEEAKRKAEEARREAEYRKEQQKQQKLRARQCPDLYRILAMAQQGYYVDPIISVRAARRFEELDCGTWLNEQLNGY